MPIELLEMDSDSRRSSETKSRGGGSAGGALPPPTVFGSINPTSASATGGGPLFASKSTRLSAGEEGGGGGSRLLFDNPLTPDDFSEIGVVSSRGGIQDPQRSSRSNRTPATATGASSKNIHRPLSHRFYRMLHSVDPPLPSMTNAGAHNLNPIAKWKLYAIVPVKFLAHLCLLAVVIAQVKYNLLLLLPPLSPFFLPFLRFFRFEYVSSRRRL